MCLVVLFLLAIAFALGTEIVAQHGSQDEILFRAEVVEGTCDNATDGIYAFLPSKEQVDPAVSHVLDKVVDLFAVEPFEHEVQVLPGGGVEYHAADPFLVFVKMVKEYPDVVIHHYIDFMGFGTGEKDGFVVHIWM